MKSILFSLAFLPLFLSAQTPFFPTKVEDAWHYVDITGKDVLTLKEEIKDAQPFYEGLAAVQLSKTELWGFINPEGKWAIEPLYTLVSNFGGGYAVVETACKDTFDCPRNQDGLMYFGHTQVIDKKGKVILKDNAQDPEPYKRFWFDRFSNGKVFVITQGLSVGDFHKVVNLKGELVSGERFVGFYSDYTNIKTIGNNGLSYNLETGEVVNLQDVYGYVDNFHEGYAWAYDYTKGDLLIDKKGEIICEAKETNPMREEYRFLSPYGSGMYATTVAPTVTYVRPPYNEVIFSVRANETSGFFSNIATCRNEEKLFAINPKGEEIFALNAADYPIADWELPIFYQKEYAFIYVIEGDYPVCIGLLLANGTYIPKQP